MSPAGRKAYATSRWNWQQPGRALSPASDQQRVDRFKSRFAIAAAVAPRSPAGLRGEEMHSDAHPAESKTVNSFGTCVPAKHRAVRELQMRRKPSGDDPAGSTEASSSLCQYGAVKATGAVRTHSVASATALRAANPMSPAGSLRWTYTASRWSWLQPGKALSLVRDHQRVDRFRSRFRSRDPRSRDPASRARVCQLAIH